MLSLLASPNIASKQWVYEQYDTMVRTGTINGPGPGDAAVVRIKGSKKGLAVKTDCNGRYVYLNPHKGGQIAVAEAARNVVCAGGRPLAITNCLNFGNPYKPEVYWTFKEAVRGMGEACRKLNTPVTGGNVSFYNENPEGAVFPTPTIGMLGLVEDVAAHTTQAGLCTPDHTVYLLSPKSWSFRTHQCELGATEYLHSCHGLTCGDAPHLDMTEEYAVQESALAMIQSGLIASAHDVSDGGLLVALAECVLFSEDLGVEIQLNPESTARLDALLFGEAQSRILLTAAQSKADQLAALVAEHPEVQLTVLGTVCSTPTLSVAVGGKNVLRCTKDVMSEAYFGSIPKHMARQVAA